MLANSNETLEADIVICNADLIYSYAKLLPETSYSRSLSQREASCSSISFYWALDKQFLELSAHNIFLAEKYKESFDSIFKKHRIPEEPSFYVNVPSRVDPLAAPPECDTLVVLVPVGHLLDSTSDSHRGISKSPSITQDWDVMVSTARETILRTIESRLHISLASHIIHESINTPPTWKSKFNLDRGAILGLSHSFFNVLCFRPKTKHSSIRNLYFVGASTHPGTGVPIVLAGAKLVAEQVLGDWWRGSPWQERSSTADREGYVGELDRMQWLPLLNWIYWVFVLVIGLVVSTFGAVFGGWDLSKGSFVGDW